MTYSNVTEQTFQDLKTKLSNIIGGAKQSIFSTEEDRENPILLLETDVDVIGFGALVDDHELNFKNSYQQLKRAYSENRKNWSRLNITYVAYNVSGENRSEEFYKQIELDRYFCRKFVVQKNLIEDINRLPFLPINTDSVVAPRRPLSAQTLIKNIGLSAELAKNLVVAQQRKSSGIVEDCLKLNKIPILNTESIQIYQSEKDRSERIPTRIKSLKLNNFRAYKGVHEFDFDADLIIIYGPNGLGKTSMFDSIDFVTTGGCGRFRNIEGGETSFKKNAHHLDTVPESAWVEVTTQRGDVLNVFKRTVLEPLKVQINGKSKDRASGIFELTGITEEEFEKRIDSLVDLFRATHLFGQDFQTLTEDFSTKSGLSDEIVSKMLAFQDYVRGDGKIGEVISDFKNKLKELHQEMEIFNDRKAEVELSLGQMQAASASLTIPTSIAEWMAGSISKYSVAVKFPEKNIVDSDKEYIRAIRSIAESQIQKENDYFKSLEKSINDFQDFKSNEIELKKKLDREVELNTELSAITDRIKSTQIQIEKNRDELTESRTNETTEGKRYDSLLWIKNNYSKFDDHEAKLRKNIHDKTNLSGKILLVEKKISDLLPGKQKDLLEITSVEAELKNESTLLNKSSELHTQFIEISKAKSEMQLREFEREQLTERVTNLNKEINDSDQKLISLNFQIDRNRKNIDDLLLSESELVGLVEKIKSHVTNSNCPACGADHNSVEGVISKLTSRSSTQSTVIKVISEQQHTLKVSYEVILKEKEKKSFEMKSLAQDRTSVAKIINGFSEQISKYEQEILKLGIVFSLDTIESDLETLIAGAKEAISSLMDRLSAAKEDLDKKQVELSKLEQELLLLKESVEIVDKDITSIQQQLQLLSSENSNRNLPKYGNEFDIDSDLSTAGAKLTVIRQHNAVLENQVNVLLASLESDKQKSVRISNEKDALQVEKNRCVTKSSVYRAALIGLGFSEEVGIDDIISTKKDREIVLASVTSLLNDVLAVETAIDQAELTAELSRLQNELQKNLEEIAKLETQEAQILGWVHLFENLKKTLENVKNTSVKEFTDKYGPLSSLIQSRLRAVYGFGKIHLSSQKGKIAITVERGDEKLRPIDYFSESQKQILVLSLFFAAAITQNWSAFAPIFLDDPVTHFDDLNAYAFLDLLSGMLQEEVGTRQFVISTCEDKLFQLMKQKFYSFGNRIKIYEFTAIGKEGPVWQQIVNE